VRQGRTDAWIAHKLDVTIEQLERFKRDNDLVEGASAPARPADPLSVPPPEPEEEQEDVEEEEELEVEPPEAAAGERPEDAARGWEEDDGAPSDAAAPAERRPRSRRGRRGGRRRRPRPSSYEATFDHGEEGYGLWLDPTVVENPVYAEHWAGHRAVKVTLDRDAITIRRADDDAADDADRDEPSEEPD
jgi:hypothetical protein